MSVRTIISDKDSLITAEIDTSYTMRQIILTKELIANPECMQLCGESMKGYFNQFVPMKSGALRDSAEATGEYKQSVITWGKGLPYAHYQYEGIVYEYNIPTFKGTKKLGYEFSGWTSIRGAKKVPTKRKMGTYFEGTIEHGSRAGATFIVEGYTKTPNDFEPTSHWIEEGKKHPAYLKWRASLIRLLKRIYEGKRTKYYG